MMLMAAMLAGCGTRGPKTVPVDGSITFDGTAEWPTGGELYFLPIQAAEGFPKRPGTAEFDERGRFTVTTFKPDDGLLPGTYQVQVNSWKVRPTERKPQGVSFVPQRFRDPTTSGIEVTVDPKQHICEMSIAVESD